MPDFQIPDPRAEDASLRRALVEATKRASSHPGYPSPRPLAAQKADLEVALLEGQIKANRSHSHQEWYAPASGALITTVTGILAAGIAALMAVGLVVGALGTILWVLVILLQIFFPS